MCKAALVGAIALATVGALPVAHTGGAVSSAAAHEIVVTEEQIARLKSALKLTPAQLAHWLPVEATLRALARQQQQYRLASAAGGFVQRTQARFSGYVVDAIAMHRLKAAADPLIQTLSAEQKDAGAAVLQSMGVVF